MPKREIGDVDGRLTRLYYESIFDEQTEDPVTKVSGKRYAMTDVKRQMLDDRSRMKEGSVSNGRKKAHHDPSSLIRHLRLAHLSHRHVNT